MSEFEKIECSCADAYLSRDLRDPNCCAHSCDYNDAVDRIAELEREKAELAAELEILASFRDEVVGIMNESQGVAGWHKNHTIATWDELLPEVPDIKSPTQCLNQIKAEAVIEAINAHKNNVLTFEFNTAIRVTDLIQYANKLRSEQ